MTFHEFVLAYIKQFKYTWIYSEFDIPEVFLYDWSWNTAEELIKVWFTYLQDNLLWDHQMPPEALAMLGKHSKHKRIMSALKWAYKFEELYLSNTTQK